MADQSEHVSSLSRDNHFVPQALLRRWATDGTNVDTYRILASDDRVPIWQKKNVRSVAVRRDLYTSFDGGKELDEFERWLSTEFERPGLEASEKLIHGKRLKAHEWRDLTRLLAAQEVRTPQAFLEFMTRWKQELPDLLHSKLKETKEYIETPVSDRPQLTKEPPDQDFAKLMDLKIERNSDGQAMVGVRLVVGRGMWLWAMRHILTGVAEALFRQRWSILEPASGQEWPMTDHPSLRLNYNNETDYNFGGGWGRRGSEIMMPLSPRLLMYTQVGKKHPRRETVSPEMTFELQRLLVERSHRWVISTRPVDWIPRLKPRIVDPKLYSSELQFMQRWHEDQFQVEAQN